MIRPTEFHILMLALSFAPLLTWGFLRVNLRGKGWVAAGLVALFVSYVATVAEGFVAPVALNYVEHLMEAVAGIIFGAVAVALVRHLVRTGPGAS